MMKTCILPVTKVPPTPDYINDLIKTWMLLPTSPLNENYNCCQVGIIIVAHQTSIASV